MHDNSWPRAALMVHDTTQQAESLTALLWCSHTGNRRQWLYNNRQGTIHPRLR